MQVQADDAGKAVNPASSCGLAVSHRSALILAMQTRSCTGLAHLYSVTPQRDYNERIPFAWYLEVKHYASRRC